MQSNPFNKGNQPGVSVIVPVRNDATNLAACLGSLHESEYDNYEIIVVDDASTHSTLDVAVKYGARFVQIQTRVGPAEARNRGAEAARYEYLLFLDADVQVCPETVRLVVEGFLSDPTIDALFGSYDQRPRARNIVSQYRNLLHHFVHQHGCEEASTFWCGCGAVKRSVFRQLGGLDRRYAHPSVEDIEFGMRLRKAGHRVTLRKDIQVTHLKQWTMWSMIRCDVFQRAIPWASLILGSNESIPNDLNLQWSQRVASLFAVGAALALLLGSFDLPGLLLLPVLLLLALLLIDRWTVSRTVPSLARGLAVLAAVGTVGFLGYYLIKGHTMAIIWALLMLACLGGLVLMNITLYLFYVRTKSWLFALLVVPLHMMYYLYSIGALATAVTMHAWKKRIRSPVQGPTSQPPAPG